MKISRNKHAAFLEYELQAQTEEFKQKINTSAIQLMYSKELFVGLYTKFQSNGEMIMMLPTSRGVPRKNEYYYCFLLPDNLRKYKDWGSKSYQTLIKQELCGTDLKCVWNMKSDTPGFVLVGFNNVSLEFKDSLERNGLQVALVLGPKVPPYEYLSNLHKMTLSSVSLFDPILDSDYNTSQCTPILIDGKTDLIEIANREFQNSDFLTLQGPPGTGKTYRIAQLCKHFCSQGKSVLVTALTNVALMSVAEKIKENSQTNNLTIYKTSLSSDEKAKCPFICHTDNVLAEKGALVLSTFYKMSSAAVQVREQSIFDYVIVDEASQAFLATLAAAFRLGKKNLWVGDICQMPPISQLKENRISREGYAPLIDGLSTVTNSAQFSTYQLTETFRLGPRGAMFTGIFYHNTLRSAQNTLFSAETKDGPILVTMRMTLGDPCPSNAIDKAMELANNFLKSSSIDVAILSHRIKTVQAIQQIAAKKIEKQASLLVETVARVQGITKDIVIFLIPNTDSMAYCLEKRLFNVATSRARLNTYIIIDTDFMMYRYTDPLVKTFLTKLSTEE